VIRILVVLNGIAKSLQPTAFSSQPWLCLSHCALLTRYRLRITTINGQCRLGAVMSSIIFCIVH